MLGCLKWSKTTMEAHTAAVYTVKFASVVYVLHAFQKKSKSGIKTPPEEIEKVKSRLKEAAKDYATWIEQQRAEGPERTLTRPSHIDRGSGNVFADLGIPNPDLALAKAELVQRIRDLITERNLTQAKAADLLGLDQPKVSARHPWPCPRLHHRPPLPVPDRSRSARRNHHPLQRKEPRGACDSW